MSIQRTKYGGAVPTRMWFKGTGSLTNMSASCVTLNINTISIHNITLPYCYRYNPKPRRKLYGPKCLKYYKGKKKDIAN